MQTFVGLLILGIVAAASASPTGRIVGGSEAPDGKYPYQVSLWIYHKSFSCGGSIINERYILTAAHCIYGRYPDELSVIVGSQMLNVPGKRYQAEKLIPHEKFSMNDLTNDIGLIRLAEKIEYHVKVQPISLPKVDLAKENYRVMLSGWGRIFAGGPVSNVLKEIELKVIGPAQCRKIFDVIPKQICTLTKRNEGACNGDSGSPLVADGNQIGIVSYGVPCALGKPDVFTRVYSYVDWINENVELE